MIYIFFIDIVPVLHVVDTHSKFQNEGALGSSSVRDISIAFIEYWAPVYIGYPNVTRLDRSENFTSSTFHEIASLPYIKLQFSGTESHNSIAFRERYHDSLRRVFLKIRTDYQSLDPEILLRYAIEALNDTAGFKGLVLSMLVFGTFVGASYQYIYVNPTSFLFECL